MKALVKPIIAFMLTSCAFSAQASESCLLGNIYIQKKNTDLQAVVTVLDSIASTDLPNSIRVKYPFSENSGDMEETLQIEIALDGLQNINPDHIRETLAPQLGDLIAGLQGIQGIFARCTDLAPDGF